MSWCERNDDPSRWKILLWGVSLHLYLTSKITLTVSFLCFKTLCISNWMKTACKWKSEENHPKNQYHVNTSWSRLKPGCSYSERAQICRFSDVRLFKAKKFPTVLPCLSKPQLKNRADTSCFEIFTIIGGFGQRESVCYPSALLHEYQPECWRRRGKMRAQTFLSNWRQATARTEPGSIQRSAGLSDNYTSLQSLTQTPLTAAQLPSRTALAWQTFLICYQPQLTR